MCYFYGVVAYGQASSFVGVIHDLLITPVARCAGIYLCRPQLCINCPRQHVRRVSTRSIQGNFSYNFNDAVRASAKMDNVANGETGVSGVSASTLRRSKGCRANCNRRQLCVYVCRGVPFIRISFGLFVGPSGRSNVICRRVGHFPHFKREDRYLDYDFAIAGVGERRRCTGSVDHFRFIFWLFRFYRVANVGGRV